MEEKQRIREVVWRLLEERGVALFPKPIRGRIPNFIGAEAAARRLAALEEFRDASVVFVSPDSPQRPVREIVLRSGKVLVMPTPRLRSGFIIIKPGDVPRGHERMAATIRGAFRYGRVVGLDLPRIDIKVTGSVAVTTRGARLGKGGGYSDLEYAILREVGAIDIDTPVVTTVHELQVVESIPMTRHDVPLDLIVTPRRVIVTNTEYPKPPGVLWDELDHGKISEIPPLSELDCRRRGGMACP